MSRILLVEDEAHIAEGIRFNLEADSHSVTITDNGENALQRLLKHKDQFDILVLDVMLPGQDGFSVARELRASGNYIPVLMLTARGRVEDILKGFEAGADDYLPKPFNLDILMARIESLLRRKRWHGELKGGTAAGEEVFRFNGKVVDFGRLELRTPSCIIQLTLMETELLRYLIRNSGRPVSRKAILEDVWGLHEDTDTRAIDNFVVRLRRYIENEPAKPRHLLTVRGLGYQFVPNP
jgi:DNA-binding response OmpR family regulator